MQTFLSDTSLAPIRRRTASLASRWGRRPRILLTPLRRGAVFPVKALAVQLADLGFDVDLCTTSQQAADAARMAVENDVHAIGTPASLEDLPLLRTALAELGGDDIVTVAWAGKNASGLDVAADLMEDLVPDKIAETAARILDRLEAAVTVQASTNGQRLSSAPGSSSSG